jgi:O-succinylbenzoic acid--CoA ligase
MIPVHAEFRLMHAGRISVAKELLRLDTPLCRRLRALGLRPGMTLACRSAHRALHARLLFLLPRMGCAFLPLDPDLPPAVSARLLEAAGPHLLIDDAAVQAPAVFGEDCGDSHPLAPRKPCLLLATSGTTGRPRLVELTGENLASSARASCDYLELGLNDRWLACLPLHHIGGLSVLLRCAWRGATAVLMERFSPPDVMRLLREQHITHVSLVPAMLHQLLREDQTPPQSLRVVLLGGAPARQALVDEALKKGWPVCPSYGLTEAASQVATVYPPNGHWREGQAGPPLPHVEVKLEEPGGNIRIRGPSVARWCREASGARRSLRDEQGWLRTGDAGWLDDNGNLHLKGRLDDMFISGGENIHPAMVEAAFSGCPGVEQPAVTALDDPRWGDALVLLYQGTASPREVRSWARRNLRAAFLPRYFFRVDALPRNSLGKLLRRELARLALARVQSPDS